MFIPKNMQHARVLPKIEEAKLLMHQKGIPLPKICMNYQGHTNTSQFHTGPSGSKWEVDPKPLLPLLTFPGLPNNEKQKGVVTKKPFKKLSRA